MKRVIAVIGQGFVGGSLSRGMQHVFDVYAYDKAGIMAQGVTNGARDNDGRDSLQTLVARMEDPMGSIGKRFTGIYFVCLPTPMFEDGEADLRIVEGTLSELAEIPGERIAVVKSTVPPGSTVRWNEMFNPKGLTVVFNPEFLTEANAFKDFMTQNRIILGGPRPKINEVKQVFQAAFPKVKLIKTSSTTAEMVKYVTNCFLATKVSFANEMAQICEALDAEGLDIDYDKVVEYAKEDKRLGSSHWAVPGPVPTHDGRYVRGFGGHCIVADTCVSMNKYEHGLSSDEKLVQDIRPGDIVISADHRVSDLEVKRVKQTTARLYDGDVLTFKTKTAGVTVTPEHILPVLRDGKLILVRAKDIIPSDELYIVGKQ